MQRVRSPAAPIRPNDWQRRRAPYVNGTLIAGAMLAFATVGAQVLNLGLTPRPQMSLAISEPVATSFSRPDIIDRNGRLLATDLEAPSLFADPAIVIDRDEVVEKLLTVLPDLNAADLRSALSDKTRRFVWVRRGLSPAVAQRIHDLGLPGLAFRKELRRAYPAGALAGHVLGAVNVDNKGTAGIEKYIDDAIGVDAVNSATLSTQAPVRLSLDVGVQHALEDELDTAVRRYSSEGAAGLILDIKSGEVIASASLPRIDPARAGTTSDATNADKIAGGTYELGSVFKTLTVAMALDEGIAKPSTVFDIREPLVAGRHTIQDFHSAGRPLTVTEIFTHSSNVGAGMLALQAGPDRTRAFLKKLGLLDPMKTEAGAVSPPQLPPRWERAELITVSYGHGIAVAPLQFAAATASILNGGVSVTPTLLKYQPGTNAKARRLVTRETSAALASMMRLNVIDAIGTGKRAEVAGFRVGGKTGTAELPDNGRYNKSAVLSSFVGAFPMDDPHYLTFILLFEPKGSEETNGQRTASTNAAPVTARVISRIAGQLGVAPTSIVATQ
ncbi:MAG TPA: penicillin-binding protein 2 [Hyphomicrobium sp.]|nr:penicillin-binding protein 2 [Hyphomicrobium sp.]